MNRKIQYVVYAQRGYYNILLKDEWTKKGVFDNLLEAEWFKMYLKCVEKFRFTKIVKNTFTEEVQ